MPETHGRGRVDDPPGDRPSRPSPRCEDVRGAGRRRSRRCASREASEEIGSPSGAKTPTGAGRHVPAASNRGQSPLRGCPVAGIATLVRSRARHRRTGERRVRVAVLVGIDRRRCQRARALEAVPRTTPGEQERHGAHRPGCEEPAAVLARHRKGSRSSKSSACSRPGARARAPVHRERLIDVGNDVSSAAT